MEEENMQIEGIDRIEIHNTAKGGVQCSVKIHKKMETKEDIDKLIELQEYAFKKIKERFPNLIMESKDEKA